MNEKNVIYTLSLGLKKEDVDVTDEAVREAEELIRMIESACEANATVGIVGISKIPDVSLEDETAVYIDFEADDELDTDFPDLFGYRGCLENCVEKVWKNIDNIRFFRFL